jgi:hypothetical protein
MNRKMLAALLLIPLTCLADGAREKSVAAIFNEYCLTNPSSFASLSDRATSEHLQVDLERDIPMPNGGVMKQKNWRIPSFGKAPLLLTSGDVENNGVHVFGCGIYVPDGDGQGIEAALSALPRMAEPIRKSKNQTGATVVWWRVKVGDNAPSENTEVMLSTGVPGMPGASINLVLKNDIHR